jgi:hypothetical protein
MITLKNSALNNLSNKQDKTVLILKGRKNKKEVSIDYKLSVEDLDAFNSDIALGVSLLQLVHPEDMEMLAKSDIPVAVIDNIIDGIIDIVTLVPSLVSNSKDKWFGVYLYKLLIILENR